MIEIDTVLFDLDGTLVDTAPDLARALNRLLTEEGCNPLPFERIRPQVSHGANGLLQLAFGALPADRHETLRTRLLAHYNSAIAVDSRLFPGMDELLGEIETTGRSWGVVTNKPGWLTNRLMAELRLARRTACIVAGDTLSRTKPDPAPLLHACEQAGTPPERCAYVGDAERDIIAGRAAGMHTFVALFGYLGEDDHPEGWGATGMLEHPQDLWQYVCRTLSVPETE